MQSISIKVIPHIEQRYPTCGDWYYENGELMIRVSKMTDDRFEFLVALHELVEVKLCELFGITQSVVDDFDMEYERTRATDDDSEPGDSPKAPYRLQHCIATGVERTIAAFMGVDWSEDQAAINALFE